MGDFKSGLRGALKNIDIVVSTIRRTGFRMTRSKEFDVALAALQRLLELDQSATILFCFLLYMYYDNNERPITLSHISNFSGCSPMAPLQFGEELEQLRSRGLVGEAPPPETTCQGMYLKIPKGVERFIVSDGRESLVQALQDDRDSKLVFPARIKERELFYSGEAAQQLDKLVAALQEENLQDIQRRLEEHKMPVGITAILYGESGTGKTESVYQMARRSGRPLFHVNIGEIISEWHNATERKLGELFAQYQKMVEQAQSRKEPVPIFLFNEADVIFGRRMQPPRQGVEISENRVQNILLEQMERLEGILIATTNMEANLDEAFSRRFLFKIRLAKPDTSLQQKIWRHKLEWLNEETAYRLAEQYQFSGGEIDNIAKKAIMEEILRGKRATVSDLEDYCKVEKLSRESATRRVGFGG
ncbi:MAG: ATP-binding protein [Spirochaetaceae bacterium]|nr:ATP-binding protein [Spirochaetaceae bacterium]